MNALFSIDLIQLPSRTLNWKKKRYYKWYFFNWDIYNIRYKILLDTFIKTYIRSARVNQSAFHEQRIMNPYLGGIRYTPDLKKIFFFESNKHFSTFHFSFFTFYSNTKTKHKREPESCIFIPDNLKTSQPQNLSLSMMP